MAYQTLNPDSVIAYVRSHPQAQAHLNVNAKLESQEIGDGNLNLVFRVFEADNPSRSVLLKQAPPYLRAAGESWPLSPDRARFEAQALAAQHRHAPGLVPTPYWFDEDRLVNAMEDLREHHVLRRPMMAGHRFAGLGETVGRFCASVHFATSDFALEPDEKRRLAASFRNSELCKITEDLVFTEPYLEHPSLGVEIRNKYNPLIADAALELTGDETLKANAAALKYRFMTGAQALIHGDLHTGSIMARLDSTPDIRVIDPEFAFFGPIGFDLGAFIANLCLSSASHLAHSPDADARADYRGYLYDQARACWATFEREFRERFASTNNPSWTSPGFQDAFVAQVLRDTVGFAGVKMIRRVVGFAHVVDLDGIADEACQTLNEARVRADGRRADVVRDAVFGGEACVLDVELNERFGMLGHEGDRCHDKCQTLRSCPLDFFVGRGTDPFHRPDTALVANATVELRAVERGHKRLCGLFDLRLIRIAAFDDALR